jgi:hypothetical protein
MNKKPIACVTVMAIGLTIPRHETMNCEHVDYRHYQNPVQLEPVAGSDMVGMSTRPGSSFVKLTADVRTPFLA